MGALMTNSVGWLIFEWIGLGGYRLGALSWKLRKMKIPWDRLFQASVGRALERHGIRADVLTADDSDHRRVMRTKRIHATQTVFDKKMGGYAGN